MHSCHPSPLAAILFIDVDSIWSICGNYLPHFIMVMVDLNPCSFTYTATTLVVVNQNFKLFVYLIALYPLQK